MIEKRITMNDGENYLVGFKEVGSNKDGIECHILKKVIFGKKSVYHKLYLKGISPDYKHMAQWTINEYKEELEQKEKLLAEEWS
jgi:hypothetical protein